MAGSWLWWGAKSEERDNVCRQTWNYSMEDRERILYFPKSSYRLRRVNKKRIASRMPYVNWVRNFTDCWWILKFFLIFKKIRKEVSYEFWPCMKNACLERAQWIIVSCSQKTSIGNSIFIKWLAIVGLFQAILVKKTFRAKARYIYMYWSQSIHI